MIKNTITENTNTIISFHGLDPDNKLENLAADQNVYKMVTDVNGYTQLDQPLYEVLKSHYYNALSTLDDQLNSGKLYNNLTTVVATNNVDYLKYYSENQPNNILSGVIYIENAYASNKHESQYYDLDFTTFTCEFSTFIRVVLLWKYIDHYLPDHLNVISSDYDAEVLFREWIDLQDIQIILINNKHD